MIEPPVFPSPFALDDFCWSKCFREAFMTFILPVPVKRIRLFAADRVLIFILMEE